MSEKYIKADGFDSAIVGVDIDSFRIVYSKQKMVECLVLDQGWDLDNAIEHLTYNVWEAYINECCK